MGGLYAQICNPLITVSQKGLSWPIFRSLKGHIEMMLLYGTILWAKGVDQSGVLDLIA